MLGLEAYATLPSYDQFFFNTRSHYVGLELYVKSRLASNSNKFACLRLTSASIRGVWQHTLTFWGLGGQRQEDLCESQKDINLGRETVLVGNYIFWCRSLSRQQRA